MADMKPCAMCGRLYEACNHCEEIAQKYMRQYGYAPWRTVACSVECYQLYDIVRRYTFNKITKAEAYELISGITDMPDLSLVPESKAVVDEILAYVQPAAVAEEVTEVTDADAEEKVASTRAERKADKYKSRAKA